MSTFNTYVEIAEALQEKATLVLRAAGFNTQFGCSNVSCSRYVEVLLDKGGDLDIFKIRFSDHDDRHGSDLTLRFDRHVDEVEDDFGDMELDIADWRMEEMVAQAVAAAMARRP